MRASIISKTSFLKERTFIYPPSSRNICLRTPLCISSTQFTFFFSLTLPRYRRRLSRFRIRTDQRERKRERNVFWRSNDRSRQFRILSFRLARLSPWTWTDFYTQLRATDWNRVTFYIYPHFPLTIGLPETAADIRGLLRTDDYIALKFLCSRFEMVSLRDAPSLSKVNFCFSFFFPPISFPPSFFAFKEISNWFPFKLSPHVSNSQKIRSTTMDYVI